MGTDIDMRAAVLLILSAKPNVALDAVQVQRMIFLLVSEGSKQPPSAFGFRASVQGPVSADLYHTLLQLLAERKIVTLAAEYPTYMASAIGYRRGALIWASLSTGLQDAIRPLWQLVYDTDFITLGIAMRVRAPEYFVDAL